MSNAGIKHRGFDIAVSATPSHFAGLWIGHYDVRLMGFGVAAASLSGPHKSELEAADNALRTAKEFVDEVIGSRR